MNSKYIGIVLDGGKIIFTKFRKNEWLTEQARDISEETVTTMLEYLRGSKRKPLNPDYVVEYFGPSSPIAKSSVRLFDEILRSTESERVKALYEEWKKTFSQVCGYEFLSAKLDVRELFDMYDIPHSSHTDISKLLFSVHTYYVLLIKFLAAEIA